MRIIVSLSCIALTACASSPKEKQLDCQAAFGMCEASIEQQGSYDWWIVTDTEYAVVTMENGERLPVGGYKRRLGVGNFGITSCQACVKRP